MTGQRIFRNEIEVSNEDKEKFNALRDENIVPYDVDRPLYKYVSVETLLKILGTSSIKFSTPHELNDGDLEIRMLHNNLSTQEMFVYNKQFLERLFSNPPDHIKNLDDFESVIARYNNPDFINHFSKNIYSAKHFTETIINSYLEQRKDVGLFCATISPFDRKMWEKYGEQKKGICLKFNFPTLFNKFFFAFRVAYVDTFPKLPIFDKDYNRDPFSILKWCFIKHNKYSFENEIRLFSEFHGIAKLDKSFFTGIYYGPYCSAKNIRAIDKIIKRNGFKLEKHILKPFDLI